MRRAVAAAADGGGPVSRQPNFRGSRGAARIGEITPKRQSEATKTESGEAATQGRWDLVTEGTEQHVFLRRILLSKLCVELCALGIENSEFQSGRRSCTQETPFTHRNR